MQLADVLKHNRGWEFSELLSLDIKFKQLLEGLPKHKSLAS